MAESTFRGVLGFFQDIGVYDVVLPFLLVFAIIFAILDKTKILGSEKVGDRVYSKKSLNSIIAFVTAFLVVASTKIVAAINTALAHIALLAILIVFFLVLIGTFFKEGEAVALEGKWRAFFMTVLFVGIVLIFMDAIGWLSDLWDYLVEHWETRWVGSLILIIIIVVFMWFITKEQKPAAPAAK